MTASPRKLYGGWPQVVALLLAHGAHTAVGDHRGKTVRDAVAGNAGGGDHKNAEAVATLIRGKRSPGT